MISGSGIPQSMLVLGAGSAIAQATVEALARLGLQRVILAARQPTALEPWIEQLHTNYPQLACSTVAFDATAVDCHAALIEQVWHSEHRVDAALLAFGILGPVGHQPSGTTALSTLQTNLVGAASLLLLLRDRFVDQGQGHLIVLSSVAACRPRGSNAVYASAKSGLDALARGLSDSVEHDAVTITVVRPGFVASPLTAGLAPAPFATTVTRVADDIVHGIRRRTAIVWSPAILRFVISTLNMLPSALYRRITSRR